MKLYFVRHTSVDVPEGTCYGQSNVPVKASFPQEAEKVKEQLEGIQFDLTLSSPLSRCRKLATYCGYDTAQWKDRLKEMHFGEWEMRTWKEIQTDDISIEEWFANWVHQPVTGGESFKMQYERVASLLDELREMELGNVLIFTHAGVINCARVYFGQTTLERAFDWTPQYGEIVSFEG